MRSRDSCGTRLGQDVSHALELYGQRCVDPVTNPQRESRARAARAHGNLHSAPTQGGRERDRPAVGSVGSVHPNPSGNRRALDRVIDVGGVRRGHDQPPALHVRGLEWPSQHLRDVVETGVMHHRVHNGDSRPGGHEAVRLLHAGGARTDHQDRPSRHVDLKVEPQGSDATDALSRVRSRMVAMCLHVDAR